MKIVTTTDLAWLAGFLDGEGTIGLHRANNKNHAHPYLAPHLQAPNTDYRLIQRMKDIIEAVIGKEISICVSNKGGDGWKRAWRVKVKAQRDLVNLIPLLMPYLVGKREQAQIVLDFCLRRNQRINASWYEFKELDEAAYLQCMALNKRGEDRAEQQPPTKLALVSNAQGVM